MTDKFINNTRHINFGSILHYSLQKKLNNTKNIKTEKSLPVKFGSVSTYYQTVSQITNNEKETFNDNCFAVQLCRLVFDLLSDEVFNTNADGALSKKFYAKCTQKVLRSNIANEINDEELIVIYTKQLIHILRKQDIITNTRKRVIAKNIPETGKALYIKLFNSFWNKVDWANIFPSAPKAAMELQLNKNIFKDLLLKNNSYITVEKVANEFFDLTGFCQKDDLMMISFVDFYLITWLKHFGILQYCKNDNNPSIFISLTTHGKKILSKCIDVIN